MSYFKANMRQIRFPLGLRPRPRCRGAYSDLPDSLAAHLRRGKGKREGNGKGKGNDGKMREREEPASRYFGSEPRLFRCSGDADARDQ